MHKPSAILLTVCSAALLAGCSSGSGLFGSNALTTQSISTSTTTPAVAAAPKVDPACYSIAQRIETLRRDGLTERLEKAAAGKSANVSVKRSSLQQAAELDKANAEFQAKCSAFGPRPMQAAAPAGTTTAPPPVNSAQVVPATAPPVIQQR